MDGFISIDAISCRFQARNPSLNVMVIDTCRAGTDNEYNASRSPLAEFVQVVSSNLFRLYACQANQVAYEAKVSLLSKVLKDCINLHATQTVTNFLSSVHRQFVETLKKYWKILEAEKLTATVSGDVLGFLNQELDLQLPKEPHGTCGLRFVRLVTSVQFAGHFPSTVPERTSASNASTSSELTVAKFQGVNEDGVGSRVTCKRIHFEEVNILSWSTIIRQSALQKSNVYRFATRATIDCPKSDITGIFVPSTAKRKIQCLHCQIGRQTSLIPSVIFENKRVQYIRNILIRPDKVMHLRTTQENYHHSCFTPWVSGDPEAPCRIVHDPSLEVNERDCYQQTARHAARRTHKSLHNRTKARDFPDPYLYFHELQYLRCQKRIES
ncbi:hypothetical protein CLF_108626 [Clonorchis sinensis]|uniref:Uncharacterized protein n=1 Tax=Clonorchis sinensis TaxID=79923 RepID=G7YIA2_CLOSI|nr:hypothetical protein CLF_108626 [Clonorchis sinensis]